MRIKPVVKCTILAILTIASALAGGWWQIFAWVVLLALVAILFETRGQRAMKAVDDQPAVWIEMHGLTVLHSNAWLKVRGMSIAATVGGVADEIFAALGKKKQPTIIVDDVFVNDLTPAAQAFVLHHEIGHHHTVTPNYAFRSLLPLIGKVDPAELGADRYAVGVVGKDSAIAGLTEMIKHTSLLGRMELKMRINAVKENNHG